MQSPGLRQQVRMGAVVLAHHILLLTLCFTRSSRLPPPPQLNNRGMHGNGILGHGMGMSGSARLGTHSLNPSPVASSYLKGKGEKYSHHGTSTRSSRRNVTGGSGNHASPPSTPSMVCLSPSKMVKVRLDG